MHPNSILVLTVLATSVLFSHAFHIAKHTAPHGFIHDLISRAKQNIDQNTGTPSSSSFQLFSHSSLRMVSDFSASLRQPQPRDARPQEDSSPEPSPEDMHDYYYDPDKHEMQWRKRLNKLMDKKNRMPEDGDEDDEGKDECGADSIAPHGAVAIALDYKGPMNTTSYIDKEYAFLRYAMGFSKKQIKDSKMGALEHFKYQFGIELDLEKAMHDEKMGTYTDEATGYVFAPLVYNVVYRVVGHSHMPIKCADATVISGGWILYSKSGMKVYGKAGGENGIMYDGYAEISSKYFVVLPATRMSTRVGYFSMVPFYYNMDGAGPFSGVVYNFDDDAFGWMDGMAHTKFMKDEYIKAIGRSMIMFPGRPRMMHGGKHGKHGKHEKHEKHDENH